MMRYVTPDTLIKNRLGNHPPPRWSVAVLCFRDREGSDGIVQSLSAKPLEYEVFYGQKAFAESPFVYEATINGKDIGVITRCIWGGPQVAILVEELAYLGVQYLIGYGSAGSIDPSLQLGQQVVASKALSTDGTSQAYNQKKKIAADPELKKFAIQVGRSLSCDIQQVTVAAVDALYRETEEAVAAWRGQGAQIINIETSAFYTVSAMCGVKSVWIGHISDRLTDRWESWHWKRDEPTRLSERICVELVRSVLLNRS